MEFIFLKTFSSWNFKLTNDESVLLIQTLTLKKFVGIVQQILWVSSTIFQDHVLKRLLKILLTNCKDPYKDLLQDLERSYFKKNMIKIRLIFC